MTYYSIDPIKTGVLFFDMLKEGFGTLDEEYLEKKASIVENAVRIREAADAHGIPVFFAKANHRQDGKDAAILYVDHDPAASAVG